MLKQVQDFFVGNAFENKKTMEVENP